VSGDVVTGGDVRAFYKALGVELPGWAQRNASVRCFASPDAHAHKDRSASCSVSLDSGAWKCWACGARGGAYDAALSVGHSPRSAVDLMIQMGLVERRESHGWANRAVAFVPSPARARLRTTRPELECGEPDVERWREALASPASQVLRARLSQQRGWSEAAIRELDLGHDGRRITIPIRNAKGALRGVLRYGYDGDGPKMLAVRGSRLGLTPHPAREPSRRILLVEGPPDMIAARSRGWPAIAVPGDHAWQARWADLLRGRMVTVVMDCDRAGRAAAERIATDLDPLAAVRVVDLAPGRTDGFDLTDWLCEQPADRSARCRTSSLSRPTIKR
jgi:hypothetical protein